MDDEAVTYVPSNGATGSKVITRISALDKIFESTGHVTIKCGNREITLPIQAVDLEFVTNLCKPYTARPRISVALVNGRREEVAHTQAADYLDAVDRYNRLQAFVYACCALNVDISDAAGAVVWSADNNTHDIEAARKALQAAGIVDAQLGAILTAANNLTQVVEERTILD